MTEAQVLALIQSIIIANGNNEITANVLRPVLEEMLGQANILIGDLGDLQTTANENLVEAINEVLGETGSAITILTGTTDPNIVAPPVVDIGDFYIWDDGVLKGFFQYNGVDFVLIKNIDPADLISTDLLNNVVIGSDGKLYVANTEINNTTENTYSDISSPGELLDDQANQTQGKLQYVIDASDDPTVTSGERAVYYYKGVANAELSDYIKLSNDEISSLGSGYRDFIIKQISQTIADDAELGTIQIKRTAGNKIEAILFDANYSQFLLRNKQDVDAGKTVYMVINDKTTKKRAICEITDIDWANVAETSLLVTVSATEDSSVFVANDSVEVFEDNDDDGAFIPLSGTEVGSPVTGDIIINDVTSEDWKLRSTDHKIAFYDYGLELLYKNGAIFISEGATQLISNNADFTQTTRLEVNNNKVQVSSNLSNFQGLVGGQYYGANYEENTYVQKKYVDDNLREENIIGSALIDLTATGTVSALNFVTKVHGYYNLTGAMTLTVTEPTLAIGETVTRTIEIKANTFDTTLPTEITDSMVGTYDASKRNFIAITYCRIDGSTVIRFANLSVI